MKKLSTDELAELRLWEKRMIAILVVVMAGLLLVVGVEVTVGMTASVASYVFLVLLSFVVLAGFIQFSQRCPRCGYRLGFQSRLLLPDNCKRCGVDLK